MNAMQALHAAAQKFVAYQVHEGKVIAVDLNHIICEMMLDETVKVERSTLDGRFSIMLTFSANQEVIHLVSVEHVLSTDVVKDLKTL